MPYSAPIVPSTPSRPVMTTRNQFWHHSQPHLAGRLCSSHSSGGSVKVVGVMPMAPKRPYAQRER
jgi:hypothetical protein